MRCPFSPALRQPCFSIAAIQHRVNTSVSLSNLPPAFLFFTCVLPLPLCLPDSCFGVCSNIFSDFRITGVTLSNCKEFFELMDNNLIAFIDETLSVLAFVVGSRRPASILSVNIGGATPRRSFHSTYGNLWRLSMWTLCSYYTIDVSWDRQPWTATAFLVLISKRLLVKQEIK